jgi:CheY-like chemotaxis protein
MQEISKDEQLQHLVTVVMTSSKADEDVMRSYKLRCSSYLVKPINFEAFATMIKSLGDYWFTLVTLPPTGK